MEAALILLALESPGALFNLCRQGRAMQDDFKVGESVERPCMEQLRCQLELRQGAARDNAPLVVHVNRVLQGGSD